jgi:hypothetical protein
LKDTEPNVGIEPVILSVRMFGRVCAGRGGFR